MRKLWLLWIVVAAVGGLSQPAAADTRDLAREGPWTAFGGTSESGVPVCGIIESGRNGRSIAVKWFRGDDTLTFQIFKDSWHIRDGAKFRISMEMDDNGAWTARATGSGNHLDFAIPLSKADLWEKEFRESDRIRIQFPDGGEDPWVGDLNGSDAIMDHMIRCMKVINAR